MRFGQCGLGFLSKTDTETVLHFSFLFDHAILCAVHRLVRKRHHWPVGLGLWPWGWMLVARRYDQRLQHSVSDESMGTLVVWFALGFILSWLRVLPIDNVCAYRGGTAGALGALWTYRLEFKRSRSMGKRRKAWQRAMSGEQEAGPDPLSVALRERDLSSIRPAFDDPDSVKHTPIDQWDQWTEDLVAEGDERNAQHTLSVAIALAPASDRALRDATFQPAVPIG